MRAGAVAACCAALPAAEARAEERADRVDFHAGEVDVDPALRELRLRRGVVVTYGRHRLTGEDLRLTLPPEGGARLEGSGRVALCPCPEPPVAFAFEGARLDPGGDLSVRWPRVEVGGVPVLALPWLWIRPPEHVGLLPPILAWRGDDGLLLGGGVHLPWRGRDDARSSLDVTAAGYAKGGVELGLRAETAGSTAHAVWDHLGADRVLVDARGAVSDAGRGPGDAGLSLGWDLDAIRGARARSGTIELEPAARPFDAAAAGGSVLGALGDGATALAGAGVFARARRGVGPVAVAPTASAALAGSLGRSGAWDALASGFVAAGGATGDAALPVARAELGAELDPRAGPFALRVETREQARFAGRASSLEPANAPPGPIGATSSDAVASGRATLGLPLVRAFGGAPGEAPLVHRVEPVVEVRGALAESRGAYFVPLARPIAPASFTADAGVTTSLGAFGGSAGSLDVRGGVLGEGASPIPVAHARLAIATSIAATSAEVAAAGADATGIALVGRGRLGRLSGARLLVDVAAQRGAGGREARAIAAGSAAALPGDELAYFSMAGVWGGAGAVVPITRAVVASVRGDADLGAPALLAVGGELAYRHPCGCFGIAAAGAHREGRGGVDAWLTVDLAPR